MRSAIDGADRLTCVGGVGGRADSGRGAGDRSTDCWCPTCGIATGLRTDWLAYQLSLTYESVMSHESHLSFVDKAIEVGFEPYLYYICTSDPDINKARVSQRVESGGHDVPEEKIQSRYINSLGLLHKMSQKCKRVYFFDNSGQEHLHFAEITPDGYLDIFEKQFTKANPVWFIDNLLMKWPREKVRIASI